MSGCSFPQCKQQQLNLSLQQLFNSRGVSQSEHWGFWPAALLRVMDLLPNFLPHLHLEQVNGGNPQRTLHEIVIWLRLYGMHFSNQCYKLLC